MVSKALRNSLIQQHLRDLEYRIEQLFKDEDKLSSNEDDWWHECAFLRFGQAQSLLLLRGYNEDIAHKAALGAFRAAIRAIASGEAHSIENREEWFLRYAFRYARAPRLHKQRPEYPLADPESIQAPADDPVHDAMIAAIDQGLDRLDPFDAAAIVFFRRGYTFKEIGQRLGMAKSTAYEVVHRAMWQLRELILPTWSFSNEVSPNA